MNGEAASRVPRVTRAQGREKVTAVRLFALRPPHMRKHCHGKIVVSLNVSPFARTGNICCRSIFCFRETKNVSVFFQKHFVSSTNVSPFARRGNNVSATVFPQQCFFFVCGSLLKEKQENARSLYISDCFKSKCSISIVERSFNSGRMENIIIVIFNLLTDSNLSTRTEFSDSVH